GQGRGAEGRAHRDRPLEQAASRRPKRAKRPEFRLLGAFAATRIGAFAPTSLAGVQLAGKSRPKKRARRFPRAVNLSTLPGSCGGVGAPSPASAAAVASGYVIVGRRPGGTYPHRKKDD